MSFDITHELDSRPWMAEPLAVTTLERVSAIGDGNSRRSASFAQAANRYPIPGNTAAAAAAAAAAANCENGVASVGTTTSPGRGGTSQSVRSSAMTPLHNSPGSNGGSAAGLTGKIPLPPMSPLASALPGSVVTSMGQTSGGASAATGKLSTLANKFNSLGHSASTAKDEKASLYGTIADLKKLTASQQASIEAQHEMIVRLTNQVDHLGKSLVTARHNAEVERRKYAQMMDDNFIALEKRLQEQLQHESSAREAGDEQLAEFVDKVREVVVSQHTAN